MKEQYVMFILIFLTITVPLIFLRIDYQRTLERRKKEVRRNKVLRKFNKRKHYE